MHMWQSHADRKTGAAPGGGGGGGGVKELYNIVTILHASGAGLILQWNLR